MAGRAGLTSVRQNSPKRERGLVTTIYVESAISDDERRQHLYGGDVFVLSPGENSSALCASARELSEEAFAPHDPQLAQDRMPPEENAAILAELKPKFIHHPSVKKLIGAMLAEAGSDPAKTYFDVPRLRTTHGDYMRAGLALQFHPHRGTWFAAPYAQLNWWLPVYEVEARNSMAFHPQYFSRPIKNSSSSTTTMSGTARAAGRRRRR